MKALTRNQQLVLDVLRQSGHQMSAYDILDKLRPQGMKAPLQVYRALEALMTAQLVHKLESLNAFVSCDHQSCHRSAITAFTICQNCGDVHEFGAEAIDRLLVQQTGKNGFKRSHTAIEIKGICERCL
ncbi:MAG TPA: transcriptional repressor [Rhizobiales bacterium]|nr:transcriptional repressor [Hyphomicrobiales bacterium]